jgi:hypothetical protein
MNFMRKIKRGKVNRPGDITNEIFIMAEEDTETF